MRLNIFHSMILLAATALALTACSIFSTEASLPKWHGEELGEGRPICTECHEDQIRGTLKPYASFIHTQDFIKHHRLYAAREALLCAACHKASFCNDCHANDSEIKPPIKFGNRPDRELIHRGDYMTLHKIDGKIDPGSCYRCHGRSNNEKCISCHHR